MKNIIYLFGVLLVGAILIMACQNIKFQSLPVEKFETAIQAENTQLVDVRTEVEYSEGHIPGALNINVMDVSFKTLSNGILDKDRPVAVYCRSGKRSKKAADILTQEGYQVIELDRGFNSWKEAGKEVSR